MTRAFVTPMVMLASLNAYSQMNPKIDSLIQNCLRMKLGSSDFDKKGIFIRRSGITYHMADFKTPSTTGMYVSLSRNSRP